MTYLTNFLRVMFHLVMALLAVAVFLLLHAVMSLVGGLALYAVLIFGALRWFVFGAPRWLAALRSRRTFEDVG